MKWKVDIVRDQSTGVYTVLAECAISDTVGVGSSEDESVAFSRSILDWEKQSGIEIEYACNG